MGSITIDEDLMDAANLIAGEKVAIVDNNNGERFETYIIKGERGSGCICLNYRRHYSALIRIRQEKFLISTCNRLIFVLSFPQTPREGPTSEAENPEPEGDRLKDERRRSAAGEIQNRDRGAEPVRPHNYVLQHRIAGLRKDHTERRRADDPDPNHGRGASARRLSASLLYNERRTKWLRQKSRS